MEGRTPGLTLHSVNCWNYTIKDIRKRPGVIGKWTNDLIYKQLPIGVLDELKSRTPKSARGNTTARLHQSLSQDIGHPALSAQITQVVTLFQLSDNMEQMWAQFKKLKCRQNGQLELQFDFDERGHTIVDDENIIENTPKSSFYNKLTQALNYNPHKDKSANNNDEGVE